MRSAIKLFTEVTYKPLVEKYLTKPRPYSYKGINLVVPPEVFHPGFFFSTKLLLNYIESLALANKTFLEPGAGSGIISFYAARKNANVTATDINPIAVEYLKKNAAANNIGINIIQSDLFINIPQQQFDFIIINPPYYKKYPQTPKEYAWYCGENGEYFENLFSSLANYMHVTSTVLMILCEGCDIQMIKDIASDKGYSMDCVHVKKNLIEKDFIFQIKIGK
jgi:release factor glutamine methyltransferase